MIGGQRETSLRRVSSLVFAGLQTFSNCHPAPLYTTRELHGGGMVVHHSTYQVDDLHDFTKEFIERGYHAEFLVGDIRGPVAICLDLL